MDLASLTGIRRCGSAHFSDLLFDFGRSCRLMTTTIRSMTSLPLSLASSATAYWHTSCGRRRCSVIWLTTSDVSKNSTLWSVFYYI